MLSNGATRGSVTKRNRVWKPGQVIDAPPGEFSHLSSSHYMVIRQQLAERAQRRPVAERAVATPVVTRPQVEVDATDAARSLADEHDIDLSRVAGSGAGGRITKGDVEALIA